MTQLTDDELRRYLLGTLPEAEAESLEDAYFADRETLERVRGAEDDLVDDYAAGRLTPDESRRLEHRWEASPRQRERLLVARALRLALPPPRPTLPGRPRWPGWSAPLRLAALLFLSFGLFWTWRARQPQPRPAPNSATADASEARPPASPAVTPQPSPTALASRTLVVLALSPIAARDGPGARPLRVPADARAVRLELEAEPESLQAAGASPLAVEVATVEGRPVWRGRAVRPRLGRPALLATVELAPERLAPGDYVVSLFVMHDGAALERYFLRVLR